MKKSNPLVYIIFIIATTVIIANRYSALYINDYRVLFFFLFFAVMSLIFIIAQFLKKTKSGVAIVLAMIITGILCILISFTTWSGDWKTQIVLYRNIKNKNETINFQIRTVPLAFGYKKRTVVVEHLAPFMDWITNIDTLDLNPSQWKKINSPLDEIKLK